MVQMPLTQSPVEVSNCSQWHFCFLEDRRIKGEGVRNNSSGLKK